MTGEDHGYSVLIVSASAQMNDALLAMLPEGRYAPVRVAESVAEARRAQAEREYDLTVVNSPLPDDPGVRFAIDQTASEGSVVLFLTRGDLFEDMDDKLGRHGVFVLPKPTSRNTMLSALRWMRSARERLRKSEKKTLTLEEKMEEIRLVNRAKWTLIRTRGMDEAAAHRAIEKEAMDRCVTRRVVAEDIIRRDAADSPAEEKGTSDDG